MEEIKIILKDIEDEIKIETLNHLIYLLQRKTKKLELQNSLIAENYHYASIDLMELKDYRGKYVVIKAYDMNGKEILRPVAIKDGLSKDSINALLDDIKRSYDEAVAFAPIDKRL